MPPEREAQSIAMAAELGDRIYKDFVRPRRPAQLPPLVTPPTSSRDVLVATAGTPQTAVGHREF
eukprot:SAG11_NODE_1887_length_4116_cov_8.004730_6_plen_64_part_00